MKMAFALLRQKTALITLCLPSTTRAEDRAAALKKRSTTSTNQRDETQYKPSGETKHILISREHGKKTNRTGNDTTHNVINVG